ncbi:MAG: response regulator transcription factor [Xenococcaceae cyanobacterium]
MKKILVVDDDGILRTVLKHSLVKEGYQVRDEASAIEALKIFEQFVPDVIISDIMMPKMNGFEFCRQLRNQNAGGLIPFIFLTVKDKVEDKAEGHVCGADDYLTKPFEMKELLAKIERSIERTRQFHAVLVDFMHKVTPTNPKTYNSLPSTVSTQILPNKLAENLQSTVETLSLPLTPAEKKVFWEVIQGHTNKQISDRLYISHRTVQTHLSNILNKLNLENRTQLVRFAYKEGYVK